MLPFLAEFPHHVFWGEVQVYFGSSEAVVAQEALESWMIRRLDLEP
jgi:hypothetical protein